MNGYNRTQMRPICTLEVLKVNAKFTGHHAKAHGGPKAWRKICVSAYIALPLVDINFPAESMGGMGT